MERDFPAWLPSLLLALNVSFLLFSRQCRYYSLVFLFFPALFWAFAAAMGASLAVIPVGLLRDWPYWVIVLEGLLITLFAIFWALQTDDLWVKGLRSGSSER